MPANDPTMKRAGEDRESLLGLVTLRTVAGGNGGQACKYCDEIDGHTGQCPMVSLGGV